MGFNLWLDESVPREESDNYVAAATDRKVTRPVPLHLQRACPKRRPGHEGAVRRRLLRAFRNRQKHDAGTGGRKLLILYLVFHDMLAAE